MDPTATRPLGRSGLQVTQLGLGGASYGSLWHQVPELDGIAAVEAAWEAGIRYFDTSPWYGRGLSELRTGAGLRYKPRHEFVISSKVGRWFKAQPRGSHSDLGPWTAPNAFDAVFDYSYDGIMRAYEQSQLRLGLPWYDVAVIHDLDDWYHQPDAKLQAYLDQLATSGWRAVEELKTAGLIRAIGAGVNLPGLIPRYLEVLDLDFLLVSMPYTLLRQDVLETEFPACEERGIGFVIGSPFQSGILATGAVEGAMADYAPAGPEVLEHVRGIEDVCARHDVPLPAAALQFVLGHPSVATVIPGARSAAHVERNVAAFRHPIPADLWAELKREGLLREDAPVPSAAT
jgi:D-threo-aldose 1-dehydrogenase